MKYRELKIQTKREFPAGRRSPGFGWLARAGYISREDELLPLGELALTRLRESAAEAPIFSWLPLEVIENDEAAFFPVPTGPIDLIHCPSCGYLAIRELARSRKGPMPEESPKNPERVSTPDCDSIDSLANYLGIPREKTAKALMYTRQPQDQFIFVVVRGDMSLSEAKLKDAIGEVRPATAQEILRAGAVPGYASPIGLVDGLIVVDDLIPLSTNLVAGANEAGYHLLNTNCGRDYTPGLVADLTLTAEGDACINCSGRLSERRASCLKDGEDIFFENILFALAEAHHDERGLTLPACAAPFDVYLMHVPAKTMDTSEMASAVYDVLQNAGIRTLFDDRDERAGVKFNDADLIGLPLRITVGEKALRNGMVEVKRRREPDNRLVGMERLVEEIKGM